LATGDLGALDADGYLVITGRKKDLFKTASGKYVAPQRLEHLLTGSALIDQAVVVGDRRPFCVALVVPTFAALEAWAADEGLAARTPAALVIEPKVVARVREEVERINLGLARHEAIRQFALLAEPFNEAEGTMTPSHKIRRERIIEACADRIEALYQEPRLRR
jgi:long-chain acyl-CoA synthetase